MSVEGSLDLFRLPEILQIVAQQGKTGILTVQGENDIVAVSFLEGRIVAADSLNQVGEDSLAQILLQENLLTREELDVLRRKMDESGGTLQEVAVADGAVGRQQLLEALRLQYTQFLEELLSWTEGDFKFYANDEVSYEEGLRPIDVQSLLLNSPAVLDAAPSPEAPLEPPTLELADQPPPEVPPDVDLSVVYERLPAPRPVRVRPPGELPLDDDESFLILTPTEQQLLSRVDGARSIADLAEDCAVDWRTALATVTGLAGAGLVRPVGAPAPEPEPEEDLQEEVFRPPDELPAVPEVAVQPRPRRKPDLDSTLAWILPVLAVAALVLLGFAFYRAPSEVLLPFPWQEGPRQALEDGKQSAYFTKMDRAAKIYYLLHSRFPDRLEELAKLHLLSPRDLRDPQGNPLHYQRGDLSYDLAPAGPQGPQEELGNSEAVTGNFLLDLDFFTLDDSAADRPIILLD